MEQNEHKDIFVDEIKMVIDTQLNIAKKNIIKELNGVIEKAMTNSEKESFEIHEFSCSECKQKINGTIYKEVNNDEDKVYCEKCCRNNETPLFKINI